MSEFKPALFAQFATIGKALSSANRLLLLDYLAQAERSVEDLAAVAGLSVANTSHHLRHLDRAGLVEGRRVGRQMFYRPGGDDVLELIAALRAVGGRNLAEVGRLVGEHLAPRDALEPVAAEELDALMSEGRVTVIDVRPAEEFAAGHLPGAVNVPPDALDERLPALAGGDEVIAYCRGPYCVYSFEAVARLRRAGRRARRLEYGYPEWRLYRAANHE